MNTVNALIKGLLLPFRVFWAVLYIVFQIVRIGWGVFKSAFGGIWAREEPKQGAQWADAASLKAKGYFEADGSFYVGVHTYKVLWKTYRKRVFTHKDQSAIMIGIPGVGKSQTIIANIRAVKLWKRSLKPDMIVTDPANGEIHAQTLQALKAMGYNVWVINLHAPKWGVKYDPFTFMDPGRNGFDKEVNQFTHLLLPGEASSHNKHFTDVPRLWITGVIAHVMLFQPDNATLQKCLSMATDSVKDAESLLEAMKANPDPVVQLGAKAFQGVGKNERGSFLSTTARNILPFIFQDVRHVSEPERDASGGIVRGWSFEDMFTDSKPTALFIRAGMDPDLSGAYVRMVVGNAINTRRRMLGEGFAFTKGLRVFIDEALSVGNILSVNDANNQLRKALVRCYLFYLSRSHIFDAFPNHIAKGLMDTSAIVYGAGSLDYEGAESISRAIGDTPVSQESRSVSRSGTAVSTQDRWERLIRPETIRQLGEKWAVVMGDVQVILEKPFRKKKGGIEY